MRTIFITSFNPFVTRNILFTDVFTVLQSTPDIRLVIFCPDYKKEYFQENFERPNVIIEGVPSQRVSRHDVIFRYLAGSLIDTETRYIHQRRELARDRRYFRFAISRALAKIGRINLVKRLVRFADLALINKNYLGSFFQKYRPQLVFAADVFHNDDIHLLAEAKARGVKTVGMIRSWDNITNKGLFRVKPHKLIVNNEIAKKEAIEYEDMRHQDVEIVGMPQFDIYFDYIRSGYTPIIPPDSSRGDTQKHADTSDSASISVSPKAENLRLSASMREEFFKRIGLDPKKRLILFSPHGSRFHNTDWHIAQILKEARAKGEIPADIQVLVRFPPNDDVSLGTFVPDENFVIEKPGLVFRENVFADRELDAAAGQHLADSVAYCDLLITYNSSMIIDAAAFDKPVIGIAFDGWAKYSGRFQSIARFMDYTHTQYVLKTGGVWVVRSREELIRAINTYLKNPDYKREGRTEILKTQVWKFDGRAGERLAHKLLAELK